MGTRVRGGRLNPGVYMPTKPEAEEASPAVPNLRGMAAATIDTYPPELARKLQRVCTEYGVAVPATPARPILRRMRRLTYDALRGFVFVAVFAAGLSLGLPFPDVDIAVFGIGAHRSPLFHGPLLAALAWSVWKRWRAGRLTNAFVGGFLIGVAAHLAVDTFVDTGGTIRYGFGSLIPGTFTDDRLWTGISALFTALVGVKITAPKAMAKVGRAIRRAIGRGWRRIRGWFRRRTTRDQRR